MNNNQKSCKCQQQLAAALHKIKQFEIEVTELARIHLTTIDELCGRLESDIYLATQPSLLDDLDMALKKQGDALKHFVHCLNKTKREN